MVSSNLTNGLEFADDVFSIITGLERTKIAGVGLSILHVGLFCKNNKQKGSVGGRPLPLRCLSQLFPVEKKINYLENEILCICLRTFHRWGGLIFIIDDHYNFPS